MELNQVCNEAKSGFGRTCTKYAMFLLNIVILIATVAAVTTGISIVSVFSSYYDLMSYGLDTMKTLWIFVAVIVSFVASFGIFTAFKESTAAANFYGIAMTAAFILQISASIYSFAQLKYTDNMAEVMLDNMMIEYSREYRQEVDWIQSDLHCCGVNGPTDWQQFDRFSTPSPYYNQWNYDQWNYPSTDLPSNATDLMPASCCTQYSSYENLKCEHYYDTGCFEPVYQILYASIMLIGTTGLIFSVVQILAFTLGFTYARIVRSMKTQRDIEVWNTGLNSGQADSTSC